MSLSRITLGRATFLTGLASLAALVVVHCGRPRLDRYDRYFGAEAARPVAPEKRPAKGSDGVEEIRATYFGTSTIYLTDGETHLLIDGFFSRPDYLRAGQGTPFARICPAPYIVKRCLAKAGITKLDAVLVAHSHYDHALDSAEVADQTGAVLVGSSSTYRIAEGWAFDASRFILVPPDGIELTFRRFKVSMVRTHHGPFLFGSTKEGTPDEPALIEEPIIPPKVLMAYVEGGSYAFHFEHPLGNVVVQPSTGYVEGQFDRFQADVVFLGIPRLGNQPMAYRDAYFSEVVKAVGAKLVIPIHWDDYTMSLDFPLRPLGNVVDDFRQGLDYLIKRVDAEPSIKMRMLQGYEEIVLYRKDVGVAATEREGGIAAEVEALIEAETGAPVGDGGVQPGE